MNINDVNSSIVFHTAAAGNSTRNRISERERIFQSISNTGPVDNTKHEVKKPVTRKRKRQAAQQASTKKGTKSALSITPTFSFYARNEFNQANMLKVAAGCEMAWRFDLEKSVKEILAQFPLVTGDVYIHGYRCEEFQKLPGFSEGAAIPYFVATCMPEGAPAPRLITVKDATQSTGVISVIEMDTLPLKWVQAGAIGRNRVFLLRPCRQSTRGMSEETKKSVDAALISGHVSLPAKVNYEMNPLMDFILPIKNDELIVDNFTWEEWLELLQAKLPKLGIEDMKAFWTTEDKDLLVRVVAWCVKKFVKFYEDELEELEDSAQQVLHEAIQLAFLAHKEELEAQQALYNSVLEYISGVHTFKIYPENEMLQQVLFSNQCNKLPSSEVTAVLPTFGIRA